MILQHDNDLETLKEDRRRLKKKDEGGGGAGQRLTKPSVLYSRDIQLFNRLLSIKRFTRVASSYENLSEQNYTRKRNNLLGIVWGQRNWLSVW